MCKKVRAFVKNINWLFVAAALTAIYVWQVRETISDERLMKFIKESELNAVGDFLAGTFAPLAFIWLVAAVLTQRQELNDTREQFAANQLVTAGQLEIVRDQTEAVQKQNDRAEKAAERNYQLNLFPERFEIFKRFDTSCRQIEQFGWRTVSPTDLTIIGQQCQFVFNNLVKDYVLTVAGLLAEIQKTDEAMREASDPWGNLIETSMPRAEYNRLGTKLGDLINKLEDQVRLAVRMPHFQKYLTVTDEK